MGGLFGRHYGSAHFSFSNRVGNDPTGNPIITVFDAR
jgi:hypothetical protein